MLVSVSPTVGAIARFLGWSFFPSFLANAAVVGYHRAFERHLPRPQPGTPKYAKQYRISFTILALLYFLYTLVAAITTLPPNYYEILGVEHDVDEAGLKTAFRNFARRNHPDRVGRTGEQRFREVRDAYEMLRNPVKRFAYEKFGSEVISWRGVSTPKEYIRRGIASASSFHIGSLGFLLIMSVLGQSTDSSFWRYVLLALTSCTEARLILSPSRSSKSQMYYGWPILSAFFPRRLPYQHVYFLHQMFVSLSVCLTQLGPVLFPQHDLEALSDKQVIRVVGEIAQRIAEMGGLAEREVSRLLQGQLGVLFGTERPKMSSNTFDDTDPTMEVLTKEMQNLVIESRLRQHPVIRTVWDRVSEGATKMNPTVSEPPLTSPSQPELPAVSVAKGSSSPLPTSSSPTSPAFTLRALSVDPGALSDSTAIERSSLSPPREMESHSTPTHSPPRSPALAKSMGIISSTMPDSGRFLTQGFLLATDNQSNSEGREEL